MSIVGLSLRRLNLSGGQPSPRIDSTLSPTQCRKRREVSTTSKEFNHGPRNTSLAAGCSTSCHSSARHVFPPLAKENLVQDVMYSPGNIASGELAPHSGKSAASWPAIIAGAFVAAGSSLILLALGSGIGFAVVSPWADHG